VSKALVDGVVFGDLEPNNFHHREWRQILNRAAIGHRPLKGLRDTFVSSLLTPGVQLGYLTG